MKLYPNTVEELEIFYFRLLKFVIATLMLLHCLGGYRIQDLYHGWPMAILLGSLALLLLSSIAFLFINTKLAKDGLIFLLLSFIAGFFFLPILRP